MPKNSNIQSSFSGGMNLFDESSKLKDDEYYLLINGRNRNNKIQAIKRPKLIQELPPGNIQGIYTASPYLIVFVNGKAYVKNYFTNTPFTPIANLLLDPGVDIIYLCLLPASTVNFLRTLKNENINGTSVDPGVNLTTIVNGSPRCALVQDGKNQPWIIFSDGTARVTQEYTQWSLDRPEYVPIGTLMLWHGVVLYLVAKDQNGLYTNIYRSVTGRPLDFMVNIKPDGDKPDLSESLGGAATVAHRVSYDEVTCLSNINSPDGSFYVGTLNNSYYVKPSLDRLIFGEPTFSNIPLFPTGPLNNFSNVDVLGDTAFIDTEGIKSFNSVTQTQNESKLDPFSLRIDNLFQGIVQDVTCAISFDLYALFGVRTIYGDGIIVYDTTRKCFSSLDIYPLVGQVKQFASLKYRGIRKLFLLNVDDQLFEVYAGEDTLKYQFTTKEWAIDDPSNEQKPSMVRLVFNNIEEDGLVRLVTYADRFHKPAQTKNLITNLVPDLVGSKTVPYGSNINNRQLAQFSLDDKVYGSKISHLIEVNCISDLTYVETTPEVDENL